jgi:hypothetical protein
MRHALQVLSSATYLLYQPLQYVLRSLTAVMSRYSFKESILLALQPVTQLL